MIKEALRDLTRRTRMMVGRFVLTAINDAKGLQNVQVRIMADEVKDGVVHQQNYGFTAYALPGAEGVLLFVGGNRDHGIAINIDDRRYRIKDLQPGEVAFYTFENLLEGGHRQVFKNGQKMELWIGKDVLNEIGQDLTEHVARDVKQTVGSDEFIDVGQAMRITCGERFEVVVGDSKLEILPDRIRLTTPLYEAFEA